MIQMVSVRKTHGESLNYLVLIEPAWDLAYEAAGG